MTVLSRRGYVAACVIFFACWAVLSAPWLSGDVTIPYDAKAHFQAQAQFLAQAIHKGQSPFWTPNVFAGSPQIADPQSLIFSPAILLALFDSSPSFRAMDAFVLVSLAIGGLAIIGFFRDRGWRPEGALIAAIAFAFGASAAWRIQHIGQIESYVFFAVTLWLLARALDRASWLWGIAAGLAAAVMLAKPDQVGFLAALALAGYVADRLLRADSVAALLRSARPLTAAALAGAAALAAPILLTYLFATDSSRPEIEFSEAARGSLHPASLLTFIVSDLFGALDPKVEYWGPSSYAWSPGELFLSQNMGQVYVGAIPALAVIGFGALRGYLLAREARYFLAAIAFMAIYALGWNTPAFRVLFDHLPGVNVFRRPADATFLIGGLAAIAAGYCVHRWLSDGRKELHLAANIAAGVAIVALVALAAFVAHRTGHLAAASDAVLKSSLWIAAACAALIATRRALTRIPAAALAIPALILTADLRANNGPNESTALPSRDYDMLDPDTKNETIRFLKERLAQAAAPDRRDRVELVGLGYAWPNAGMVHGFDHTLGFNPLRLQEFVDATGAGDTIAGWDQKQFTPMFPRYNCRLANLLGLRYVVSRVPIEQVDTHFRPGDLQFVKRTADGYIYENPRARPRVMFAQEWRLTDFEAVVETGRWPEFDPAKTVLFDSDPAAVHPDGVAPAQGALVASAGTQMAIIPPQPRTTQPSTVALARYENTEIEVSVEAGQAGFVVLNDIWHPWWTATLDGKPVPILKANVLFRAVQVPPGRHAVRFSFKPLDGALAELAERLRDEE